METDFVPLLFSGVVGLASSSSSPSFVASSCGSVLQITSANCGFPKMTRHTQEQT